MLELCQAWPHAELGDDFRAPVSTDRPALFLSGTLDGHTPPGNTEEVMAGFTEATHIVIDEGSHQHLELGIPQVTEALGAFLRGESVSDTTYVLPLVFVLPDDEES